MKTWKVYFTNWEYSIADDVVVAEFDSEEKAWTWVDAHEYDLTEGEESYEVAEG